MNRTMTRTAAAAAGVLLAAVGFSAPAYAGDHHGSQRNGVHATHRYGDATLAEVKAWVDRKIEHRLDKLDRAAAWIAESDRINDEQRARWSDKIADAQADLVDLRSAVAAADSKSEVRSALRDSDLRGCFGWHRHGPHNGRANDRRG